VGALPRLLGFHPHNSLVVVCLHGPRCRIGLVMRFDLVGADGAGLLAQAVADRVGVEDPSAVAIAVFGQGSPDGPALPHVELVDALTTVGMPRVLDALLVVGDRWWSYHCVGDGCCGPDGNPVDLRSPETTAVAAACALAGQGVLADRAAVAASIALSTSTADEMSERIAAVRARGRAGPSDSERLTIAPLAERMARIGDDPRCTLAPVDVAELAGRCHSIVTRDQLLLVAQESDSRDRLLRLMVEVVRQVPPPHDAPVCTVLAWLAYAAGDGVLAGAALDRALGTDPGYSLAQLLARALDQQVHPAVLDEIVRMCG
jgi:hypothetical protein